MQKRVFRVDTPHDVASATVVAGALPPGANVLVLCSDKSHDRSGRFASALRTMAAAYRWNAVIDISSLPMTHHWLRYDDRPSRLSRLRDTLASLTQLRERLAPAFGLLPTDPRLAMRLDDVVDELYFSVPTHSDTQALYKVLPSARKYYLPHSFASLLESEILEYGPLLSGEAERALPPWLRLLDRTKGFVFGPDAVPVRSLTLDAVFTFNAVAPWRVETRPLGHQLHRGAMDELFASLHDAVRQYYRSLAAEAGGGAAVLLLNVADADSNYPYDAETAGYVSLARYLRQTTSAAGLLVKPHPRGTLERTQQVVAHLERELPDLTIIADYEHSALPAEVILSPFSIVACAGIASSALASIRRIYGVPTYFSEELARRLYSHTTTSAENIAKWLEADRGAATAI